MKFTDDESIILSKIEVAILVALAAGQMTGYEIMARCRADSADELDIKSGTLYPALDRLERVGAIERVQATGVTGAPLAAGRRAVRVVRLRRRGRLFLEWELATYRRMVRLGEERL